LTQRVERREGNRPISSGLGLAAVPLGTEEDRAFLQQRLLLVCLAAGTLSLSFLVLGTVAAVLVLPYATFGLVLRDAPTGLHAFAGLFMFAGWAVLRRGRWSIDALHVADATLMLVPSVAYSGMAYLAVQREPFRQDFVLLLVLLLSLLCRAIVVPSTGRRTMVVSAASCAPVLVSAYLIGDALPAPYGPGAVAVAVFDSLWCFAGVAVATMASRVIYGLREKAAAARRLGQYTLGEKIGEGGMGAVYRASHAMLRRPTAIKLLPPERAGAELIARFEREVHHTSMLTHPSTVTIFDYGRTPDGVFYYAMEYLDGVDLERLVTTAGAQPPSRVVHILAQVCGSLAEAHGRGLVHRDIKPANVILCERGGVPDVAKVVDFGLVKDFRERDDLALSAANLLLGTPLYMAPEGITSADAVGPAGDLYALGAVAYFLLTGASVFRGANLVEICAHHLHSKPVPPSERGARGLDPELEALVLGCLAKKPHERPASALALRDALLACPIPRWTEREAIAFWAQHGRDFPRHDPEGLPSAKTELAVDVANR
jgi:hypothetical protein